MMTTDLLDSVESQVKGSSIRRTREEYLRESWMENCYSINTALTLPVEVADALGAERSVKERMVGEISEFLAKLTISDFLEGIHLDFESNIRETRFQITLSVAEPSDGYKKGVRRWYNYNLPPMDAESRNHLLNILIRTFVSRSIFESKGPDVQWKSGPQLDIRAHTSSSSTVLREDMDNILRDGGRVSLQRVPLTLRTKNRDSAFFRKYGELRNYSLQG